LEKWGPYLSERQWGTVREDYSENGDAWNFFTHDHARSRAYRWGEDGLGGISDEKQRLCFALALWNGKDPILKEEGAQASVEAVKKVGKGTAKGVKSGTEEVEKWFKGIGEGIQDLGSKF
jgi:hypothetical protein